MLARVTQAFILLEDGEPVAEARGDLVVPWWSFGKTLIAATALRLVEQGRLSPDDQREGLRLGDLLRHEAGLRDYGWVEAYHRDVARGASPWGREEMLERAKADQPVFAAGQGWSYSNIGYMYARERIEQAHGGDLGQAARDLVFAPLGVEDARMATAASDLAEVEMGAARGYDPRWVYHGLFVGPLRSAAVLLDGLLGARSPLSEASRDLMAARRQLPEHGRPPWSGAAYGLGLMCPTTPEGWIAAGHTGGGPSSVVAVYRRMEGPTRTAAAFALGEDQTPVEALTVGLLQTGAP